MRRHRRARLRRQWHGLRRHSGCRWHALRGRRESTQRLYHHSDVVVALRLFLLRHGGDIGHVLQPQRIGGRDMHLPHGVLRFRQGNVGTGSTIRWAVPDEASLTPPIEGNITSGMSHAGLSRNCMPSSSAACCPAAPAPSCAAGSVLPSAAVGTGTFPMTLVAAPAASAATASPSATALYSAACRSAPGSMPCTASRSPVSGSPAPSPASSHCISRSCASCSFIIRPRFMSAFRDSPGLLFPIMAVSPAYSTFTPLYTVPS